MGGFGSPSHKLFEIFPAEVSFLQANVAFLQFFDEGALVVGIVRFHLCPSFLEWLVETQCADCFERMPVGRPRFLLFADQVVLVVDLAAANDGVHQPDIHALRHETGGGVCFDGLKHSFGIARHIGFPRVMAHQHGDK